MHLALRHFALVVLSFGGDQVRSALARCARLKATAFDVKSKVIVALPVLKSTPHPR